MTFWIHITAGQGPAECHWAVARAVERIQAEARDARHSLDLLEVTRGDERDTLRSALLSAPDEAESFARTWEGTHLWHSRSPYRPQHKRRNWFFGVQLMRPPTRVPWSPRDVVVETFRSSGPGGQHANTTDSAVRVTHQPTGHTAIAQEERSQRLNKQLAFARLAQLLEDLNTAQAHDAQRQRWSDHHALERGSATRTFRGPRFQPVP